MILIASFISWVRRDTNTYKGEVRKKEELKTITYH